MRGIKSAAPTPCPRFLEALDHVARDTVSRTKLAALGVVAALLGGHPEQEQVRGLLSLPATHLLPS